MKKRYLFPLLYLVMLGVAMTTLSGGLVMILWFPSSLPLLFLEVQLGMKQGVLTGGGSILFDVLIGGVPYLIMGLIWDWLVSYFRNKSFSGD